MLATSNIQFCGIRMTSFCFPGKEVNGKGDWFNVCIFRSL